MNASKAIPLPEGDDQYMFIQDHERWCARITNPKRHALIAYFGLGDTMESAFWEAWANRMEGYAGWEHRNRAGDQS